MLVSDPRSASTSPVTMECLESLCYVRTTSTDPVTNRARECEILINSNMLLPPVSGVVAIGIGLCRILHLDESFAASASLLLSTHHPTDCQRVLSDLRVSSDAASIRESVRGLPGAALSAMDQAMVELKPFRGYRLGEIVAYDERLVSGGTAPAIENSSTGEVDVRHLRYGRVAFINEEGEVGMRKITLRIGSGVLTLLPTDIYTFKSARDSSLHHDRDSAVSATGRAPFSFMGRPSSSAATTGLRRVNGVNSFEPHAHTEERSPDTTSVVSTQDVLGAVSSLLHRAGLPLSMEKQVSVIFTHITPKPTFIDILLTSYR